MAARIAPDDPKVVACHAIALLWTGTPEEALDVGSRLVTLSPSYAEGLVYYGDILIHNGRSEEALPYFEKALRLTPFAPQLGFYKFILGEAYIHHGNFAAAEQTLLSADTIYQGTHQGVLRYLAGAQLELGKIEEARRTLAASDALGLFDITENQAMMSRFTTDDGGPYFQKIWADLVALSRGEYEAE